ncbi:MAG: hypothetical protein IPJ11_01305 [Gemmatimonadetes bacterium]|nr:hypothetical protein [Gemmatimonadota bacterium]
MSCEPMLMQLLEAEPDELRRVVDTPLTRHLADCPKCAAVADRLIADTAQLAFAVRADAAIAVRPARRLARLWMVPGVAAAAVALLLWRDGKLPAARAATAVVVTPAPVVTMPAVVAEVPRPAAVEAPPAAPRVASAGRRLRVRPEPQLVAYRVEPVVVTPMPAPVPVSVAPTALDPLGGSEASRDQPAARGTVLRSTVPGVTVIWSNK